MKRAAQARSASTGMLGAHVPAERRSREPVHGHREEEEEVEEGGAAAAAAAGTGVVVIASYPSDTTQERELL